MTFWIWYITPPMLRAIFFDCDGTIVDSEPIHLRMFQKILEAEGISLTKKDYYDIYLGMDDKDCFQAVMEAKGRSITNEKLRRLIQQKAVFYEEAIRKEIILYPGIVSFIKQAAKQYPLAVVSGALRNEIEIILQTAGIREAFKLIISAEDVDSGKPNPEGFQKALEAINACKPLPTPVISPGECLVVEDSIAGVEAAGAAGMRCLAITNSYGRDDLKGADQIVDTVEALQIDSLKELF